VETEPTQGLRTALLAGLAEREHRELACEEQRRGRPRSPQVHGAIMLAAVDLLVDVGFDGLTMERVAQAAGVGKATVYRRWGSKVELVSELLETMASAMPLPDTGDVRADLVLVVTNTCNGLGNDLYGGILPGLAAELSRNPEMAAVFREGFVRPRRAAVRTVIERGIARGEIREDLDVEVVVDMAVAPMYYRRLFSGMPITVALAESVVDTLLAGALAAATHPATP
jgi:AcrR family transcriptional regulator